MELPAHTNGQDRFIDRVVTKLAPVQVDGCWLWTGTRYRGYAMVWWEGKFQKAHRLVWERFHGPIPAGMKVCHRCDVRNCINLDHLFLGSYADNNRDMANKVRAARGERNAWAKLTERDVVAIRAEYAAGRVTQTALAQKYDVSQSAIWSVLRGRCWSHVSATQQGGM